MADGRAPPATAARAPQAEAHARPTRGAPPAPPDFPIVGIGASAGGLDAYRKLLDALPPATGMAYILVQHLDPSHESMMVELLASHTPMKVVQAADGMRVEADHCYLIPPGLNLAVRGGALRLSPPVARHGSRLPFDFLLHSLARECGAQALCVVLSGTGSDGSAGLREIAAQGGLVIVQDPAEAGYDGMPRSAIATGAVDHVLQLADIPAALAARAAGGRHVVADREVVPDVPPHTVQGIIDLLRSKTPHDFSAYKPGTLQRRIERRMALLGLQNLGRYFNTLRDSATEAETLAKDLLINVTSFFRDPEVFKQLGETVIPDLVRHHASSSPIRIWIAGCSTGEETYSLAMLFREAIAAAGVETKLQVFASDVDADAVAAAREGLYPAAIEADVSPARLARFFAREDDHYRVSAELRSVVVFTVQDVLTDAPFSRLDMISCRNLLIYLRPDAQSRIISLFHFALREGGVLLLGNAETAGNPDGRFDIISKPERLYRRVGRNRPGELALAIGGTNLRPNAQAALRPPPTQQNGLVELCRRLVLENYAPASVLINRRLECLYLLGATDRFLHVPPGPPTQDLLAMARQGLRTKLRSAIQKCQQENARVLVAGGSITEQGRETAFNLDVHPVPAAGEDLLLICFVEVPRQNAKRGLKAVAEETPRVAELNAELDTTRTELQAAIHNLELSNEEQNAINEEALSIQEEYQSTNEELLTSKEELQSLNEELTALNTQLQETLERQRTTSNDLQNVLYSTDVATVFLDMKLNIRFFTPATKALFSVIPSDIGRPLADLNLVATDRLLLADAGTVLQTLEPLEREIDAHGGSWYVRRILPYRTHDNRIEGVVVTFSDITERRHVADALSEAKRQADLANVAKSRFLAAASHDLRQPLQTLSLLQGLLARTVDGDKAKDLVARLADALATMSDMLNTLLDINQIEAGTVRPEIVSIPVNDLLLRLRDQFEETARAQGLQLRVVKCGLAIQADPALLEQMLRNLLSNALKYTRKGKVLLGCRRHGDKLGIEVWDTGVGIPEGELGAVFEEYHQLDNPARERARGLGLGLTIVQRLGKLLGHPVRVRSRPGHGSMFAIDVDLRAPGIVAAAQPPPANVAKPPVRNIPASASILVIEDDPDVRSLLELLLSDAGYDVMTSIDGNAALEALGHDRAKPDLVLADYNLPGGMDGLRAVTALRERLKSEIPAVILTGDMSTSTLRNIEQRHCTRLTKPVRIDELTNLIRRLLAASPPAAPLPPPAAINTAKPAGGAANSVTYIVDDDRQLREAIRSVLEEDGRAVEDYASGEAFLEAYHPGPPACLLIDAYLPGMNGIELLQHLKANNHFLPAIMITGNSDVAMAVQAMKAGASDFIEKPIGGDELLASIDRALEQARDSSQAYAERENAAGHLAGLTPRQHQVMDMVLAGHPSKNIAADLGISQRTVENHRASIMRKTGSRSLPALARLALAAAWTEPVVQ
ncbi:MAG: chemotaxis protein CheB, partial [Rhodospirillales bacterium]